MVESKSKNATTKPLRMRPAHNRRREGARTGRGRLTTRPSWLSSARSWGDVDMGTLRVGVRGRGIRPLLTRRGRGAEIDICRLVFLYRRETSMFRGVEEPVCCIVTS